MRKREAFKYNERRYRQFLAHNLHRFVDSCALCQHKIEIGDMIRPYKEGYIHQYCYTDPTWAAVLREHYPDAK